jgi:hypothetical protein
MKKLLFVLAFTFAYTTLNAQQKGATITFTPSLFGMGSYYNFSIFPSTLEYDRQLGHNFSVSLMGLSSGANIFAGDSWEDDLYVHDKRFVFAGAKLNYNLPVARKWLLFRAGIGGGVGWHHTVLYENGRPNTTQPHFIVDAWWVIRAGRRVELRFAPLLVSPSQLLGGSTFGLPGEGIRFTWLNYMPVGVGLRF